MIDGKPKALIAGGCNVIGFNARKDGILRILSLMIHGGMT